MIRKAIPGMPRGHGRTGVNAEKVVDRQICALSRRPLLHRSKLPSKENIMVVPVLGNCEQRCVLTFLTLDINLWKFLAPFPLFIQGSELTQPRDQLHSTNLNNAETSDSHNPFYQQPTIFIKFDSQKEQDISSPVNPLSTSGSAETATDCRSSTSNVLGPHHGLNQKKSVRNTLNNSGPTSAAPKDSSMLCDGSDVVASDISAGTITQVDKSAKQSSKKKGKKKRKQHKRSMHRKASAKPDNYDEEVNCDASASETSASVDLACSIASESNLPLIVPTVPVQDASDIDGDKLNMECNAKNFSVRSSKLVTETLITSSSKQSYEISLYNSHSKNPEIHMAEESPDDFEDQSTVTKDSGFNSLADEMILNSGSDLVQCKHKEQSQLDTDISNSRLDNCSYWQKNLVDADCSTERDLCNIQASSSDDFQPVIRAKRVRLARKFSVTSNGVHRLSNVHLQRCSEKDNRYSIWQKVEKASTAELNSSRNSNKLVSRPDDVSSSSMEMSIRPKNLSLLKPNSSGKSFRYSSFNEITVPQSANSSTPSPMLDNNSSYLSPSSMDGSSTFPEKLKRKPNLDSEQETLNIMHTSKKSIHRPSRIQAQQKEGLGTAIDFKNICHLNDRIECSSRTTQNSNSNALPATTLDKMCSIVNSTSSNSQEVLSSSSMIESTSGSILADVQSCINIESSQKMKNDPCICTDKEDDQCISLDIESAHLECSGTNSLSVPILQKWVPVGRKDSVINRRQMDSAVNSILHDCIPSSLNSNLTDELLSSNSHRCFSSSTSSSPSSGYLDCSSPEEDEVTSKLVCQPCTSVEVSSGFPCPSGCRSSHMVKDGMFPSFETDLEKIIDAASASYKLLVAAEGVQLATGSPLAEFERLLQSASPVLEIGCVTSCKTCPPDLIIADSLCFHQVPNISLRRLWQWYEKPGNYGLEVKVEDLHAAKRSLSGFSEFRAYFVPYLSAVQLFARSRMSVSCPTDYDGDKMKTCKVCNTSKLSTCPDSLPLFSKLVPQPYKGSDTWSTQLPLASKFVHFSKSICRDQLADEELLFEYFDSDQPQQRRPLFDKIEELIRGDLPSNCNFYGDPMKLGCMNLNELHPASWYTVAWYPIYRIPDGSFRAAFLTYHSFGQFVCRSNSNRTAGCFNSLISPVVGLQSYNAKGECWFEPSNMYARAVQAEATFFESPEIFKCRLQSLEETAHVMSRATVRKGNLQYTNRHPDYEFFLSRRR